MTSTNCLRATFPEKDPSSDPTADAIDDDDDDDDDDEKVVSDLIPAPNSDDAARSFALRCFPNLEFGRAAVLPEAPDDEKDAAADDDEDEDEDDDDEEEEEENVSASMLFMSR